MHIAHIKLQKCIEMRVVFSAVFVKLVKLSILELVEDMICVKY